MARSSIGIFLSIFGLSAVFAANDSCKNLPKAVLEDPKSSMEDGSWIMIVSNTPSVDNCTSFMYTFPQKPADFLKPVIAVSQIVNGAKEIRYQMEGTYDKTMDHFTILENGTLVDFYGLYSNHEKHYYCMYTCNGDRIGYIGCATTKSNRAEAEQGLRTEYDSWRCRVNSLVDSPVVYTARDCTYSKP